MTYGFLLLFAFVRTISYQNWFVIVDLYYLELFTMISYHLNAHIMLLRYVICNYIWHMGGQNYELLGQGISFYIVRDNVQSILTVVCFILGLIDPLGRPTVTTGSDQYFLTQIRPYVHRTFQHFAKPHKCQVKIVIAWVRGSLLTLYFFFTASKSDSRLYCILCLGLWHCKTVPSGSLITPLLYSLICHSEAWNLNND